MSIAPTRILRSESLSIMGYVHILLRRDIPVHLKEYAIKILKVVVPSLVLKHPEVINLDNVRKLTSYLSLGKSPEAEKDSFFSKASGDKIAKWYIEQLEKSDNEKLMDYFERVGMLTLVLLSEYLHSTVGELISGGGELL